MAYIPPPNFGIVEDDLYRSGEPNELSTAWGEGFTSGSVVVRVPAGPVGITGCRWSDSPLFIWFIDTRADFPFLEKLELTKVVYLAPDDPSRALYVGWRLRHVARVSPSRAPSRRLCLSLCSPRVSK